MKIALMLLSTILMKLKMSKKYQITDHAIVRFLERHKGKNLEKIKSDILKEMRNGKIKCVVKDGCIITILPHKETENNS